MPRPPDHEARAAALAPDRSFIVQAPAGSGKTELLIQRYLALLPTVERPEQVVALTFSRKAAAEMGERVAAALQGAAAEPPEAAHARRTWELARAVLAHGEARGWDLLDHPGRLRIQTIDALCLELARRMPLLARLGPDPTPTEEAGPLYREAARRTLAQLGSDGERGEAVARLFAHLDAQPDRFIQLVGGLLARRDQWLVRLGEAGLGGDEARRRLEETLRAIVEDHLRAVREGCPPAVAAHVPNLGSYAADNLEADDVDSPIRALAGGRELPVGAAAGLSGWLGVARLLLTNEGPPRKPGGVNVRIGFPPGKAGSAEAMAKDEMQALLAELADHPGWCQRLHRVRDLPSPVYDDAQWRVVEALVAVLLAAVAELWLLCGERGEVDFGEVALQALHALGSTDDPSDLLLALDQGIAHLLVDEFQDTSRLQWGLVERLTAGWEAGDGRTLFLVGDPMQSIYRFREAEVGLFLHARQRGIGDLILTPLTLAANFRSREGVVAWVNDRFARLFPGAEDEATGGVVYAPSAVPAPGRAGGEVVVHPCHGGDPRGEAETVAALCRAARDRGEHCAVLVRARRHAEEILPALTAAGLAYQAEGLLPLGERPAVEELLALTRALLHPLDRIAWLACLRAPAVGLDLCDLHALCGDAPDAALADLLGDDERLALLGPGGAAAARRFREVMARATADAGRRPLAARVEGAWLALGGAAAATPADGAAVSAYLDCLAGLEEVGEVGAEAIATAVARLYAPPDPTADPHLQVMTIHKAKGLEFDTVIVPGLGRPTRRGDSPLLRWFDHPTGLLAAATGPRGEDQDPIYRYVAGLERQAEDHETLRLLYVAATRARRYLHLLGHTEDNTRGEVRAPGGSLLAHLWPAVAEEWLAARDADAAPPASPGPPGPPTGLRRLVAFQLPEPAPDLLPEGAPVAVGEAPPFRWAGEIARHVGTIAHGFLQRVASEGLTAWDAGRVAGERPRLRAALAAAGVPEADLEGATERAATTITRALADPRGRWLLAPHAEAACELPLAGVVDGRTVHYVLDRTFVDESGTRWIVDYKSSTHEGGDVDAFLAAEWQRYRPQLERYARLMAGLDDRPIRLGLYHPLLAGWQEAEVAG